MKHSLLIFFLAAVSLAHAQQPVELVDPMIGTADGGNTFPGAIVPWGMVSVSPQTVLHAPSAYSPFVREVVGFGHVHLSGVGCTDLGNIALMPTTGPVATRHDEYKATMSSEQASPGYYRCTLGRYSVDAEMTSTERVGFSRYTFPKRTGDANVLIDVTQGTNPSFGAHVAIVSDSEVEGWNTSGRFCFSHNIQNVYFVARFSKHALETGTWKDGAIDSSQEQSEVGEGSDLGAWLRFSTDSSEAVYVKVGISYVSIANARLNLESEIPGWDFDDVRASARERWAAELSRIKVTGGSSAQRTVFYTALYHALIHPNVFNDVNGEYRLMGGIGVGKAVGYTRYSVYSLWDTYRTLHPLLALAYPDRQLDMVKTMVEMCRESAWLPKWELAGVETRSMVGDPAPPVIIDTWEKGIRGFDLRVAYDGMKRAALDPVDTNWIRPGIRSFLKYGYLPMDDRGSTLWLVGGPVSTSLEYNFADWTIARTAEELGEASDYTYFLEQSQHYRLFYDSSTGFLRPKLANGAWYTPFTPLIDTVDAYIEGSAWDYLFFVPHDIPGLTALLGGEQTFVRRLQEFFDIKQFIWNEHDLAFPFLFTTVDREAWRTQRVSRTLMKDFTTQVRGIPSNDDAGELSAWYVCAAIGFYPCTPGMPIYRLGSPIFDTVSIALQPQFYPGGHFVITVAHNSDSNIYIQSAQLGGRRYDAPYIRHERIVRGDTLSLVMGPTPSGWGRSPQRVQPISPADGTTQVDRSPLLRWEHADSAIGYRVQVARDILFKDTLADLTVSANALRLTDLPDSTRFCWRVRAIEENEYGEWSRTAKFSTAPDEMPFTFVPATDIELDQNTPNPASRLTTIRFALREPQQISLVLFNALGEQIAVLASGTLAAGEHTAVLDARQLFDGVYFYRLTAGSTVEIRSLVIRR
jgi:predicted alpha-1,2-mannosidase